jgi:hypothetical protein
MTGDSSGNPTNITETNIGTLSRKRVSTMTYDGSGNILTQEVRIKESDDTFLYGIRKVFAYTGNDITGITKTILSS